MPPRIDLSEFECSVARTLDVVGDKWTLLVVRDAFYGVRRFEDFTRDLGIARNVLTDRLNRLVDAEILERHQYEERPPRHEYRLTRKGRALQPVLLSLMRWGDEWADGEPPVELVHRECGQATHAVATCAECGGELTPFNVRIEPLPPVIDEIVEQRRARQATSP